MKILKYVLTLCTLSWMVFIFQMSAATGTVSSGMSERTVEIIGGILHPDFEEWTASEKEAFNERLEFPLRKMAHFLEYTLLGALLLSTARAWNVRRKTAFWLALGAGILYAASDEIHQLMVMDRSGQWTDVVLDSFGVLAGCLLILGLAAIFRRKGKSAHEV